MKITDKTIQAYIKQSQKDITKKYLYYSIGENLWFRVHTKTGAAAWLFRIAIPDNTVKSGYKFTNHTIGKYPSITLLQARTKAMELSAQVKSGINPVEVKQLQEKSTILLHHVWAKWIDVADIKPITKIKLTGTYKQHLSKLANTPMELLTDKMVWDTIIQPILDAGNKPQAKIVLGKLKQLSRFAYETHLIVTNPLDRLKMPSEYKVKKVRERTLNTEELSRFTLALEQAYEQNIIDIRYHHFIKLVLLLGTRKTELAVLKWEYYNPNKLTILLTETKTNDDLLIKLPHQAVKLFEELYSRRINNYVFYGTKEDQHMSIRSILYSLVQVTKLAKIENLTIHDLRRTFSSRLSGLKFRLELIEKATNHKIQGTSKHYQHDEMLEERYEMLQTWANYLDNLKGL